MQDTEHNLAEILTLPRAGRALACGMTGSGKTTLKDDLRSLWLQKYPQGYCLIADTKPRYRAQWEVSGLSAAWRYRKWEQKAEAYLPGSYVLDLARPNLLAQMKLAFRKSRVVIVQGSKYLWGRILEAVRLFYEAFSARKGPRLLDVDETADFFEVDRFGGILLQALRSGRELGLGVVMGCQRPKFIPKALLTESDRIYLFKLKNSDDFKAIQIEGGWPKSPKERSGMWGPPARFWEFRYWNFLDDSGRAWPNGLNGGLYQLARGST